MASAGGHWSKSNFSKPGANRRGWATDAVQRRFDRASDSLGKEANQLRAIRIAAKGKKSMQPELRAAEERFAALNKAFTAVNRRYDQDMAAAKRQDRQRAVGAIKRTVAISRLRTSKQQLGFDVELPRFLRPEGAIRRRPISRLQSARQMKIGALTAKQQRNLAKLKTRLKYEFDA